MTRERLFCKCGKEVGVVRLNGRTLAFGHKQNPGPKHHVVRLAKPVSEHPGVLARTREPNSAPSLEGTSRRTRDEARSEPGSPSLTSADAPVRPLGEHLATRTPSESWTLSAAPLPPSTTPMGAGRRLPPSGR